MGCMMITPKNKMPRAATLMMLAAALAACGTGPGVAPAQESDPVRIRITAGSSTMVAQLDDNPTARDFAALLPLRLPLRDHASTEKVATLPRKLSLEGAPGGADADAYDLAYYAPLGNFVIYYRDPPHYPGLVRIGRIQTGAETVRSASGTVTIETVTP